MPGQNIMASDAQRKLQAREKAGEERTMGDNGQKGRCGRYKPPTFSHTTLCQSIYFQLGGNRKGFGAVGRSSPIFTHSQEKLELINNLTGNSSE